MEAVDNEGGNVCVRAGGHGNSLNLLLNVAINLKLL